DAEEPLIREARVTAIVRRGDRMKVAAQFVETALGRMRGEIPQLVDDTSLDGGAGPGLTHRMAQARIAVNDDARRAGDAARRQLSTPSRNDRRTRLIALFDTGASCNSGARAPRIRRVFAPAKYAPSSDSSIARVRR